jgi:AraC-like DNA-binding protein
MGRLIKRTVFHDQSQWFELARISGFRAANLARHLGISQRQVERYVRRHFNRTPQQWLRELRMARAGELTAVMHSVKEIAYALGFQQVSSFCREFKTYHGVTCSEYAVLLARRSRAALHPAGQTMFTGSDWAVGAQALDAPELPELKAANAQN